MTSRTSGEGAEWPASPGPAGRLGAPVGSPGCAIGAGATTGVTVVPAARLAGAFFAAAFAGAAFFTAAFLAGAFFAAGAFLAVPRLAGVAAGSAFTAFWRASLSAANPVGRSPRSSVVIVSPSS